MWATRATLALSAPPPGGGDARRWPPSSLRAEAAAAAQYERMRGRCEKHALAFGPSGCVLCRREAAASATVDDSAVGAAPVAASAADVDPEQPRLTLRLPPIVLALPLLALATFGVFHTQPWQTQMPAAGPEHAAMPTTGDEANDADDTSEALGDTDDDPRAAAGDAPGDAEQTTPSQPSEEPLAGLAPELEPPARSQGERATASPERAPAQAERGELDRLELERARAEVEVVVYYAQWCGYCTKARAYLAQRGIRSVEHDVDGDSRASGRHRRLNPRGSVPTLEIDGQVLVGFDARSIERAIDRAARARLSRERG